MWKQVVHQFQTEVEYTKVFTCSPLKKVFVQKFRMGQLRFSVKRLEEISFEAAYKEILANLSLIPTHRPEERRNLASYSSLISVNPFFTSENVRTYIKNRLAQTLIGTFNDETRQKFVEQFNQYDYDFDSKSLPSIFFDVVRKFITM